MDNLTREQRHKNMSHIRSSNTKPEILLRKALWHKGVRYRKNDKRLIGKPDIAITRYKIAVFVDSEFFHGRDMNAVDRQVKSHREYWLPKIRRNKERDAEVNDALLESGWLVLRFWTGDVTKNLERCVQEVLSYIPHSQT